MATAHTKTKTEIPWDHNRLVIERLRARGDRRADAIEKALKRYEQRWGVGR